MNHPSPMYRRLTSFACAALLLLTGCTSLQQAKPSPAPTVSGLPATARNQSLEAHFDRVEAEIDRVGKLQRKVPALRRSARILRLRFEEYRDAEHAQRKLWVSLGIQTDAKYYRLQHEILDGHLKMLRLLEESVQLLLNPPKSSFNLGS